MKLTHDFETCQLKTVDADEYNLALGERWEAIVVSNLNANGLEAYRPKQNFATASSLKRWKALFNEYLDEGSYSELYCRVSYTGDICSIRKPNSDYKVLAGNPEIDKALLRPYQRDVMVKISKYKRLSVEVKALTSTAWNLRDVQIGCCPKWDDKKFKVDAVIIINQGTSEAFVAPSFETWIKQPGKTNPKEQCYAVNQHLLKPLDVWIDETKQKKLGATGNTGDDIT